MRDYYNIKINLPGGIASPGYLKDILSAAWQANVRNVRFGSRQQMLMTVHYEDMRGLERNFKEIGVIYETNTDRNPNIVSSYCGEDVFRTGQWLVANEYHSVLDSFDFEPLLKINISDSNQSFTPFFTGNLNFISSPEPHFWYLYVRFKQSNLIFKWKDLIYTNEIGKVAKTVETCMLAGECNDEESLFAAVNAQIRYVSQPAAQDLELPSFSLPYYEGFNRYESRTWLGLYRRDEQFPIELLLDICALCLKTRIGEICTTPWKSLVIKGIIDQYRAEWSGILGKHNINVRHAANELAWQTEDHNQDGAILKNKLLRYFEKNDTRTFGLCFGIQTRTKSEVFGSILVKKRPLITIGQLAIFSVYDIYYTENFNPNSRTQLLFEKGLFKIHVAVQLERLCRRFNNQRSKETFRTVVTEPDELKTIQKNTKLVHQCPDCLTVYDPEFGDISKNIPAGTLFDELPGTYCCPTCDTAKSAMQPVEMNKLIALNTAA
ncbi:rubredoxin [Dyadobacter pollutisoli]|uniref:Rubredoxin n=1 Tax=Dyadobacter pollutisoli TaxID=2910158 RepID=A0A9E8SSB5_9BACT|nr:rubredoxin [Dyadobacter pollutisoli]WAC15152.1 rubredoxin [Dyadobacter pollutisoli]